MTTDSSFWEEPEQVETFAAREPDLRLAAFLDEHPDPASITALDLGCAGGRNAVFLAERGVDVHAVDSSRAMVEHTRARLAAVVGEREAAARVHLGSMDDLGWAKDGAFDLVVALGVFHNAGSRREWDRALAEAARVLAPGGRLLVANFTPETDLTGDGLRPVPGEPHVYEGLAAGRGTLVDAPTLDREMARFGLEPVVPTETARRETERGRRVTANALYSKSSPASNSTRS